MINQLRKIIGTRAVTWIGPRWKAVFGLAAKEVGLSEETVVAKEFDCGYLYLTTYPDIQAASMDPLRHFLRVGWKEGRNPNSAFETSFYLSRYPDVGASASE